MRVSYFLASPLLGAILLMGAAAVPSCARDAQSAICIKDCWPVGQGLLAVARAIMQLETFNRHVPSQPSVPLVQVPWDSRCKWLSCSCLVAGLIQPSLLDDGQVCVDMGEPILEAERIPTTLAPTQAGPCIGTLMS